MEINKLILPISIIVGVIILGGFYYASEANKQASAEKMQILKIKQDCREKIIGTGAYASLEYNKCISIIKDL